MFERKQVHGRQEHMQVLVLYMFKSIIEKKLRITIEYYRISNI